MLMLFTRKEITGIKLSSSRSGPVTIV